MERGFTLIELVISIFILTIAIVGIFSAFSIMVILTGNASDSLTGAYLAQEGMEIVRNVRDNNWLKMDANPGTYNWNDSFENCTTSNRGCEADYTTGTKNESFPMRPYAENYLKIDDLNGFYNYTNGTNTKFKRQIIIDPVKDGNGNLDHIIKVSVTVFWDAKPNLLNPNGTPGSITTEEYFYDWYNYK